MSPARTVSRYLDELAGLLGRTVVLPLAGPLEQHADHLAALTIERRPEEGRTLRLECAQCHSSEAFEAPRG